MCAFILFEYNLNRLPVFFKHGTKDIIPKRCAHSKSPVVLLKMMNGMMSPPEIETFRRRIFMNHVMNAGIYGISHHKTRTERKGIYAHHQVKKPKENGCNKNRWYGW